MPRETPTLPTGADVDRALVEAARRGEPPALARLYEKYAPVLHGVLLAHVSPAAAEDLVHDAFVVAIRRLGTLRAGAAFGGWIIAIARNLARDMLRRQRADPLPGEIPSGVAPTAEMHEALAAIRNLPDAYRETLMLRLVEGLSGPEIAARTGLTPGSVRVNLHRGMQMLRDQLGVRNHP
ncbi:MAG: RNA polymerase sigma factor [Phycisphaerae bacterium]